VRVSKIIRAAQTARLADVAPAGSALPAQVMRRFASQPGFLLSRVNQIYVALHNEVSNGQTPAQAEFMLLLASSEKPDQISLARAAGVDTSTTALVLANLEARGLVLRESDPDDRRRSILRLTSAARRQMSAVRETFIETQSRLIEPLGEDTAASLARKLRLIGANPMSPAPLWIPEDRHAGVGENVVTSSFGFLSRRALQVSEAYFLACAASLNLTPRQFSVLFIVNRMPQLSQIAFSRIFGLDPATCAVIMKNLASRGLLDRKVSTEDRRERLYSLTAAGKQVLEEAQPLVDKSERLVLRALTRPDVRVLVSQLLRIVKAHSERLGSPGVCFTD
jgi:DNA-binding MarR family transcriptional regulator